MKRKFFAAIAAAFALVSCSEADIDLFDSPVQDSGTGSITLYAATISTLDLSWQPVDGVMQYGYTLTDPDDKAVRQGVTKATSVSLDHLEQNTAYTFVLEALGANGKPTLRYTTTVSTEPIVSLATPDVSNATVEINDGVVSISWPEVAHANTYDYELKNSEDKTLVTGTVYTSCIVFNSLPIGDYVLLITADSYDEGYTRSETVEFRFSRERQVSQTFSGTYKYYTGESNTCTLNVYDNGDYSIEAFYGVEGYNLEFTISREGVITILNPVAEDGVMKYVATGLSGDDAQIAIHQDTAHCTYSVLPTGKRVKLYVYRGQDTTGGYDTFTWK